MNPLPNNNKKRIEDKKKVHIKIYGQMEFKSRDLYIILNILNHDSEHPNGT